MTRQRQGQSVYWHRRLIPVAGVGVLALALGVIIGAGHQDGRLTVADRYVHNWSRGDWTAMYRDLTKDAQQRTPLEAFARAQREALEIATATRLIAGKARKAADDAIEVPLTIPTRIFGTIRRPVVLPLTGDGDGARVNWRRDVTFPGMPQGTKLSRTTVLPPRATLLTRDGQVLARDAARTPAPAVADVAAQTVGQLGPIPQQRVERLRGLGVPDEARVGIGGLERALDERLLGQPGGTLRAGDVVLASTQPRQAGAVRTTIAPDVVRAAVTGLAGRLGGIVAFDPRDGAILGFAGIAFSGLQPPGSTFKMVTLSGSLQNGVAKVSDTFPVVSQAVLSGVSLENANGEYCGGTLARSFALSCNSVFAPLGVKLGPAKLVATAEAFGFNRPPDIPGAATSTLPAGNAIGDDLAVGSTAIGQGQVQATALQMASIAGTIGLRGVRPNLTLDLAAARSHGRPKRRAIDAKTARIVEKFMLGVVRNGTGVNAAIGGVKVAGKTGTAELESTKKCEVDATDPTSTPEDCASPGDPTDTDAWFTAYAPAGNGHPRVAVGVMLVRSGAGGDTAAPIARQLIETALKR